MEVVDEYRALRQLLQERCPDLIFIFRESDIKSLWDAGFESEANLQAADMDSLKSVLPGRLGIVAVLLRAFAQSEATTARSFSIAEQNANAQDTRIGTSHLSNMTYENLVQLENVRCVASVAVVAALPVCCIGTEQAAGSDQASFQVCVICQGDYELGDSQVKLPCEHAFHHICGAKWLLNYSRLCPLCKHDITDAATVASSSV